MKRTIQPKLYASTPYHDIFLFNIIVKGPNSYLKTGQKASPVKQAKDFL